MTDEEKNSLFQYIDDWLTELEDDYASKTIGVSEYFSRINTMMDKHLISKGMSREKDWLEWRIENVPDLSDTIKDNYRQRIIDIENGIDCETSGSILVGVEVDVLDKNKGRGIIVRHSGKFITVEFPDKSKATYDFEMGLRCRSLKFASETLQADYEQRVGYKKDNVLSPEKNNGKKESDKTLNAYINFVKAACNCSLYKQIFSCVPVIHSEDDMEYFDSLTKIYDCVFTSSGEKRIYQDTLISGARRWDTSVEGIFKRIADKSEGIIHSIDISNFSPIDPIFIELLQNIHASGSNSKRLFVLRIKNNDRSTAGLISAKMPVFEICHSEKSVEVYAEKLYSLFPSRIKGKYSDMKDTLIRIVDSEKKRGKFSGEQSLEFIALNISYFANKKTSGKNIMLDNDVLSEFYHCIYKTEIEKKSALQKLREMTGFEYVLELAERLIAEEYQNNALSDNGCEPQKLPRHIIFRGPSGCGKTTAARLISEALNEAGISQGFYEVNARSLCGRYLGETRVNVQTAIKAAGEGVLFIDEAYSLSIGDEYGQEAISAILTEMENPNSNLIIIFAGYKDEMDQFLNSNPGLRSRIGHIIDFKPYTTEQLFEIAMGFLKDFRIDSDAEEMIRDHFYSLPQSTVDSASFGLARHSRNVASKIKSSCARRAWLSEGDATEIKAEDVESALSKLSETEKPKMIGFSG